MVRIARSLICFLLIASMLFALDIAPALAMSVPACINNSKATIYSSSGETGTLRAGTAVTVTATKKGWAKFSYNGHTAYTRIKYLTAVKGVTAYVKKPAYVYKSASTSSKKYGPLEVGTELSVVGINGDFFQVTNGKANAYIAKSALSKKKPSKTAIMASKVQKVEWSKGKSFVSRGKNAYIYDILSGTVIHVHRLGGSKHMEFEPLTAEDTQKLLSACGGKFSWSSRPVILYNGNNYVAAAINTMPHGDQSITTNNYDGQFCLHLVGSKTHGSDSVNSVHQSAIKYAYSWAQSKQ